MRIRTLFHFNVKRYHYQLNGTDAVEQCPVKHDTLIGSIWCNHFCRRRHRSNYVQQWVECPSLNRWLRKNKRLTVPVKKGVDNMTERQ